MTGVADRVVPDTPCANGCGRPARVKSMGGPPWPPEQHRWLCGRCAGVISDADGHKFGCLLDPAHDGDCRTSADWVSTEDCSVIWLRGHIGDRDLRRQRLEQVVNFELDYCLEFMELVAASRAHTFVWMRVEPAPPESEWHGGDWYKQYDEPGPDVIPYTRIELEDALP